MLLTGGILCFCRKKLGDSEQLLKVALLGNADDTVEVADYFKGIPGHEDKAVMLYSKVFPYYMLALLLLQIQL